METAGGLIVKVQPPHNHPNPNLHHVPCDIVLVIDVSGSMSFDAPVPGDGKERTGLSVLDLTKHAALTILETMDERDRLGIVTFGSEAKIWQGLLPMDSANKPTARAHIMNLKTKDCTNLWHGILSGIQVFKDENTLNQGRVPAIMVLTDGQPNYMCPPQGYVPKLRAMGKLPATIHTFGFGYDLRSGLLKSIAEVSGGNYAFIPDAGMIGTVFVHAVANLQATFANNAVLRVTSPNHIELEETTGESVDQQKAVLLGPQRNCDRELTIALGNIQYGQSRDIYLRNSNVPHLTKTLKLMEEDEHPPVVTAVLEYSHMDGKTQTVTSTRLINDTNAPALSPAETAYHMSRSSIIELLSHVAPIRQKDGEHVPVQGSQKLAVAARQLLKDSSPTFLPAVREPVQTDPQCQSLLEDLRGDSANDGLSSEVSGQILLALEPEYFTKWGVHYLLSLANAHAKQICNSFKDPGPLMYGTESPLFIRCRDRLDAAFDTLPPPKPSKRTTRRGPVAMRMYNNSAGPCFAGCSTVVVASGAGREARVVEVRKLRPGMDVSTPRGPRKVVSVLKTRVKKHMMCPVSDQLVITPWHPVSVDGKVWAFPANISHRPVCYTGSIYSVLLEKDSDVDAHAVRVGGVWGVTLGHGVTATDDVRAHAFLGDYQAVVKSFARLRKARNGVLLCVGILRDKQTGLMRGFKRTMVPSVRRRPLLPASAASVLRIRL